MINHVHAVYSLLRFCMADPLVFNATVAAPFWLTFVTSLLRNDICPSTDRWLCAGSSVHRSGTSTPAANLPVYRASGHARPAHHQPSLGQVLPSHRPIDSAQLSARVSYDNCCLSEHCCTDCH